MQPNKQASIVAMWRPLPARLLAWRFLIVFCSNRHKRRRASESGQARQTVSLVRYQGPTTLLTAQRRSSRSEKAKSLCTQCVLTGRAIFHPCSGSQDVVIVRPIASPYAITDRASRVPKLIPVLGIQPAGDVSHTPGGRLPLLSTRARNP